MLAAVGWILASHLPCSQALAQVDPAAPQARYFVIQRIGADQVAEYARRKGAAVRDVERWLRPVLAYEPQ